MYKMPASKRQLVIHTNTSNSFSECFNRQSLDLAMFKYHMFSFPRVVLAIPQHSLQHGPRKEKRKEEKMKRRTHI